MIRLKTPVVQIGKIKIGGENPVAIQSMTTVDTANPTLTAKQCIELAKAGAEMIRITVDTPASAGAIPRIRKLLDKSGFKHLPLIGDFHFNGHKLLNDFPETAKILDKYRINPGNVGFGKFHDENFSQFIKIAVKNKKPVRIGVNSGSLDPNLLTDLMNKNARLKTPKSDREVFCSAMVESALQSAKFAEKLGLKQNRIVLSVKMTDVTETISAYQLLAFRMQLSKHPYALHLGLTEAGSDLSGTISSTSALSILLQQGIGDTIRVSLTPNKTTPRTREVEVCKLILQSLNLRFFSPRIISCPGCGRADNQFFQTLSEKIFSHIQKKLPLWQKKHPHVSRLRIAVMGCVVNGPGESRHADIALSLPGRSERKIAEVYIGGEKFKTLVGKDIAEQFLEILESYVKLGRVA